ncbi:MAG: T9SS type A sorting domain-containing protein [Bacteroidetes bacterium]|nr:T9SS type A sorting domain-containing protein [Bacteroidota bacterium]
MQIRYRVAGTTTWQTVSNSNGYRRLTGLIPDTFYEYQWRANWGGTWDQWFPSTLYFYTKNETLTGVADIIPDNMVPLIYPNPVSNNLQGNFPDETEYYITDISGRICQQGFFNNNNVNVTSLESGLYILIVHGGISNSSIKFVKK